MALTLDTAALHVLGKSEDSLSATERATLGVVVDWANEAVAQYLAGSPAPAATVEAATLRLVYYDWHSRLSRRPGDGGMLAGRRRHQSVNPMRESGGMSLLSPWKRRTVAA